MEVQAIKGNADLLEKYKTTFLCSRRVPEGVKEAIEKWIGSLSKDRDCIVCGNQSPMEKFAFSLLLERKIPVILLLAETMPSTFSDEINAAIDAGLLFIATHCDTSVHRVTSHSALDRNLIMLALAQETVVGHCSEGGSLERVLDRFDNVSYLITDAEKGIMPGTEHLRGSDGHIISTDVSALKGWCRRVQTSAGVVYMDFLTSDHDAFLKITQVKGKEKETEERNNIFFDFIESENFLAALRFLLGMKSNPLAGQGLPVVSSASGEITTEYVPMGQTGAWTFTQTKVVNADWTRIMKVSVDTASLGCFAEAFDDMLHQWSLHRS